MKRYCSDCIKSNSTQVKRIFLPSLHNAELYDRISKKSKVQLCTYVFLSLNVKLYKMAVKPHLKVAKTDKSLSLSEKDKGKFGHADQRSAADCPLCSVSSVSTPAPLQPIALQAHTCCLKVLPEIWKLPVVNPSLTKQ